MLKPDIRAQMFAIAARVRHLAGKVMCPKIKKKLERIAQEMEVDMFQDTYNPHAYDPTYDPDEKLKADAQFDDVHIDKDKE